jgi:drug/metabolite transporter (DMT)-like permease
MERRPVDRLALAAFIVAVLVLGANPVGIRFTDRELPPFFGAAVRFAASSVVLFAVLAMWRIPLPRGRALAGAVVFGLLQDFLTFALIYWGLVEVTAGMFAVVFATLPLWTIFLATAAGFERLTARSVIGTFVAVGGLAIVFAAEISGNVPLVRVGAIVAGALLAAASGVIVKAFPRTSPVATNAIGTLIATPLLLLLSAVAGERWIVPQQSATWLAFAFLVFSTVVGFISITFVVLRWTPSAAAYQVVLSPVVTVLLATLLADEVFGPGFLLGAVVVGIGVYVGAMARTARTAPGAAVTAAD